MVFDQLKRTVNLSALPQRIVSTVPSQTELLFYLGLDDQVAGITNYCTRPADQVKNKINIGGTKQLDVPLIIALKPDLIIANKEENDRKQLTLLIDAGIPVYISDPANLPQALQMIVDVGTLTGKQAKAGLLSNQIKARFSKIAPLNQPLGAAYLIWRKPYMVAGNDTFINDMLQRCGFANVFDISRYPAITPADLMAAKPQLVLLSSEPFPFRQKHIQEFKAILPHSEVILVDGEMFSWYGSRMLLAANYFLQLVEQINSLKDRG